MHRLPPLVARVILAGLLFIIAFGFWTQQRIAPPPRNESTDIGDTDLQLRTIERIRRGEPYYDAVGTELRTNRYPTKPIVNWRTPLHYELVATLSVDTAGKLLYALGMAVVVTAALVYARRSVARAIAGGLLLLGTMAPAMLDRPGAVAFPEHWAAAFIALSLNAYIARQWVLGASLGVVAVFLRELASPYALICGLLALRARRSREWKLWIAGGISYFIYYAIHVNRALDAVHADDLARVESYWQWLGLSFVFMTLYANGLVTILPTYMTPVAAAAGLAGGLAPSAPAQLSVPLFVYFILFCVAGQPFNFYWGYLTAPLWGHAFVHSWEGIRALLSAAANRVIDERRPAASRG
jgi:hypothetical protein